MVTFDPAKRDWTFDHRGLAFEDAEIIFADPVLTVEDTREDYGERRFQSVGSRRWDFLKAAW